jgi:homoserine dehydrogenase
MEQESLGGEAAPPVPAEGQARLIFITHEAREADLRATLHELRDLDVVSSIGSVLRVIGTS